MAATTTIVVVRNTASSPPGARVTGLAPSWVFLARLADGVAATQPAVTEVGQGQYKFAYDAEANGEASGQLDFGAGVPNPSDRYVDVLLTRDSSRVQAGFDAAGRTNLGRVLDQAVTLDGHNLPNVNAQDWAGALIAAALPGAGAMLAAAGGSPPSPTTSTGAFSEGGA